MRFLSRPPISSMSEIKVKLEEKTIIVKKLPLGRYAELIKQLKKLPTHVQNLPNMDNATILANLPDIIEQSQDDFYNLLAVATDLKPEEIKELGLYEAADLLIAVIEVNKYREVYDKIKKALARPDTPTKA